jgi:hypothetical protein
LTNQEWLELWFLGKMPNGNDRVDPFIILVCMLCNHYIWELKLKKNRGSGKGMVNEVVFQFKSILRINKNLNEYKNIHNFNFCRLLE